MDTQYLNRSLDKAIENICEILKCETFNHHNHTKENTKMF